MPEEMQRAKEPETCLCYDCMALNPAANHFCKDCGAPLDAFAAISPFERTLSEGNALLKATSPATIRSLIYAWAVYGSTLFFIVLGSVALLLFGCVSEAAIMFFVGLPFSIWSVIVLVKAHRNYKPLEEPECAECISCGAKMPESMDACPSCGWTFKD